MDSGFFILFYFICVVIFKVFKNDKQVILFFYDDYNQHVECGN